MTFKAIGKLIGKDPTTVSYEVKHHRQAHKNSFVTEEAPCHSLLKAPFVCNGCPKKHSSSCYFMRCYYRANNAQAEYKVLLTDASRLRDAGISIPDLFGVLLCDNGGEFADVFSFESDDKGDKKLSLFFCDPMPSSQKPQIEKNHTLFRDIVPKGSSFDDFTQDTVALIFSHVNSVSRKIYAGKPPLDMFSFIHGEDIASLMGISRIPPRDVVQTPDLLKSIADLTRNL